MGSDGLAGDDNVPWVNEWVERDTELIEEILIESSYDGAASKVINQYFSENLKHFVGVYK